MQKVQGFVEQGNTTLAIAGAGGTIARKVQGSFPGATVTAYINSAPAVAISSISRAANIVTVTIPAGSGFIAGEQVTIAGVTDASFNGTFTILVSGATTFTYAQTAANASSSGGTATSTLRLATIYSDDLSSPTVNANPFVSASSGNWFFYVTNGIYDVKFSGAGIATPFTLGAISVGSGGGVPSYATASLPTTKTQNAGNLSRVTDGVGGLWMDSGTQWVKQSPPINPLEAPFNAVGNGIVDDTTALQAALTAGDVVLPPGFTFLISNSLLPPSNRNIYGSWRSTIKLANNTNVPVLFLRSVTGVLIQGVRINGNKANQTIGMRGVGVYIEGSTKCTVTNCLIEQCAVYSLEIGKREATVEIPEDIVIANNTSVDPSIAGSFNQHYALTSGRKIIFANNVADSTDGNAATMIDLEPNNAGNPIEDVSITGNIGRQVNGVFLNSAFGKIIKRITVSGNTMLGTGAGHGDLSKIFGATQVTYSGNVLDTPGQNGLLIDSSDTITVVGNTINDFGSDLIVANRTGIRVTSSQSITVDGNVLISTRANAIGIEETTADCITFVGVNRIDVPGAGAYSMLGANSTILPNFDVGGAAYGTWTYREARADTSTVTLTWAAGVATMAPTNANFNIAVSSLQINSATGTPITGHFSGTASLDFAAWAGNDYQDKTINVTAAVDGDTVDLGIPDALASIAGLQFTAWVSSAGVVTVRGSKITAGASANPGAVTIRADVWKH